VLFRSGIQPRAVRAAIIGFPNIGKSALINRLLGRKMAKSRNLPGVTRSLQWVRLGGLEGSQENVIELLDSPGIIPARQFDQTSAIKLAICNDIGEASYDRVVVAGALCDYVNNLWRKNPKFVHMDKIIERYKFPFNDLSGEDIVHNVATRLYRGNSISASDKILSDFRKGYMGFGSLESPPWTEAKPFSKVRLGIAGSKAASDDGDEDEGDVYRNAEDEKNDQEAFNEILEMRQKIENAILTKKSSKVSSIDGTDEIDELVQETEEEEEEMRAERQKTVSDEQISYLNVGRGNYDGW